MTRDDIIRMAREAGLSHGTAVLPHSVEYFAALVAATEREECARVCEDTNSASFRDTGCPAEGGECAKAIRARSEK